MIPDHVPISSRHDDPTAGVIPIHLITGFLGSGKMTLLNRLINRRTRIVFIARGNDGPSLTAALGACVEAATVREPKSDISEGGRETK